MKIAKAQLKRIIKEELSSVLNERETDSVYQAILELFNKAFLDPANLDMKDPSDPQGSARAMDRRQKIVSDLVPRFFEKMLGRFGKYLSLRPDVIEEYAIKASQIPGVENLFREDEPVGLDSVLDAHPKLKALFATRVNFIYEVGEELSSALGWFDLKSGEVSINFGSPLLERELDAYSKKRDFDKLTEANILEFIVAGTNALPAVFEHEMTHMIDYHRAGGVPGKELRPDAGMPSKAFRDVASRLTGTGNWNTPARRAKYRDIIKYANSTSEIQARITHIFKDLKKNIRNVQAGEKIEFLRPIDTAGSSRKLMIIQSFYERFINTVLKKEPTNQSTSHLIKILMSIYERYYDGFLEITTDQNMKRIVNRFYDFSTEMIEEFNSGATQ